MDGNKNTRICAVLIVLNQTSMTTDNMVDVNNNNIGKYMISVDTGGINYQNVDFESNVVTDDMFVLSNTNVTIIDFIVENNNATVNNMFTIDNSIANLTNEFIESNRLGVLTSGNIFSLNTTILSITNVRS